MRVSKTPEYMKCILLAAIKNYYGQRWGAFKTWYGENLVATQYLRSEKSSVVNVFISGQSLVNTSHTCDRQKNIPSS